MSRFRFSITSFFVVVTLVALGMAALVSQSRLGGSLAYTVFLAVLCLALAGAILRPLPARAFWLGFAVFGWTYWLVEFDAASPPQRWAGTVMYTGYGVSGQPRPGLVTRDLIGFLEANLTPNRRVGARVSAQWRGGSYYPGTITQVNGDDYLVQWDDGSAPQWTPSAQLASTSPAIQPAAHSLFGSLFALLGGVLVAILFGGRSELRKDPPAAPLS